MSLFKKKPDPISERARELNAKIAALQSEIKRLSQESAQPGQAPEPPAAQAPEPASPAPKSASPAPPLPRLRSTALPHGPTIVATPAFGPSPQEPVFEDMDQERLKKAQEPKPAPADLANDLGTRKSGFFAFYQRVKEHFRGPATSNPKLVNYLAAGSIQGLRPLRYEKRVARNRFIVLAGGLILLLLGIIAMLLKR